MRSNKKSQKSPAARDLDGILAQARFGGADATLPVSAVAHTMLPPSNGNGDGVFHAGIFPLGDVTHLVTQVIGDRVLFRSYKATLHTHHGQSVIDLRDNCQALVLHGEGSQLNQFQSQSLGMPSAIVRAMMVLSAERLSLDSLPAPDDRPEEPFAMPRFYAQWSPAPGVKPTEVSDEYLPEDLRTPVRTAALDRYIEHLRSERIGMPSLQAPFYGTVTRLDTIAESARCPAFLVVDIASTEGQIHTIMVPDPHPELQVEVGMPIAQGTQLHNPELMSERALAFVAWDQIRTKLPGLQGTWIDVTYLGRHLKDTPPTTIVEDVRHLIGAETGNDAILAVAANLDLPPVSEWTSVHRETFLREARRANPKFARYATDEDYVAAIQPGAAGMVYSRMPVVQAWAVGDSRDLAFDRSRFHGCRVSFNRVRPAWAAEHGPMDPTELAVPVGVAAEILSNAANFAPSDDRSPRRSRDAAGREAGHAAAVAAAAEV